MKAELDSTAEIARKAQRALIERILFEHSAVLASTLLPPAHPGDDFSSSAARHIAELSCLTVAMIGMEIDPTFGPSLTPNVLARVEEYRAHRKANGV